MRPPLPLLALLAALTLAACGGGAGTDRPNADATLLLDFTPNAAHAGIYSAVQRGFDAAEGVHLHVRVPGSSTDGIKLLLSGRTQFAVLDIHDLALAAEQGRDLVGVMALVQRPLAAVLTVPGVKTPRELEGRKVGVTGLPSDDAVLRSIVTGAGGSFNRVERVTIGFNAVPALLGGRVAGATAFWNVEGVALRAKRPGVHVFRVDDYGAPPYPELILCTSRATLREQPALVRATIRALVRGYGVTLHDPASSLTDEQERVAGLDRGELERQLDVLGPALVAPGGRVGELDPDVLARWARWEARFGIVKHPPDVARLFDTALVP
ncbi:MAG TPA: ABC transporter substrate-binding protein [Conexibacter sp.]|nr:ABC transporter substrate-binding protein [Conexibacter sp.]